MITPRKKRRFLTALKWVLFLFTLKVVNLIKEGINMYEMIKQCYDWGVYTADYVKSYFVDKYQSITQEQYEQIVAAKQ